MEIKRILSVCFQSAVNEEQYRYDTWLIPANRFVRHCRACAIEVEV
jgi:hypothetical protein